MRADLTAWKATVDLYARAEAERLEAGIERPKEQDALGTAETFLRGVLTSGVIGVGEREAATRELEHCREARKRWSSIRSVRRFVNRDRDFRLVAAHHYLKQLLRELRVEEDAAGREGRKAVMGIVWRVTARLVQMFLLGVDEETFHQKLTADQTQTIMRAGTNAHGQGPHFAACYVIESLGKGSRTTLEAARHRLGRFFQIPT